MRCQIQCEMKKLRNLLRTKLGGVGSENQSCSERPEIHFGFETFETR